MSKTAGRKKRIIITTAAMLAIGGGAAFAYWTSGATQDEKVTAAAASTNFTISVDPLAAGTLSPGAAAQTAKFTVNNPGTGVQKINAVTVTVAEPLAADWSAGNCTAKDFEVSATVVPTELAANQSVTGTVTLKMINRVDVNQNDCKGVSVPLHFVAS